jgi:hypothetical protein
MKVEKKGFKIDYKNFEVILTYEVIDVPIDIFTGDCKEQIDEIVKQNSITDILLAKFLQENPMYRVATAK